MLPLEVVDPGGSLSTVLYSNPAVSARHQLGVLAGGNGDGGIQLRPDDGGAPLQLEGGWRQQRRSDSDFEALDSKLFESRLRRPFSYQFS
jgi:hypothetical protein